MFDRKFVPTAVRSPYKSQHTEIDWADDHQGRYPHEILRGYCPCAGCQGHSGEIQFIEGGDTTIRTITPIGDYALQFEWGDGHDSGLYSFRYLRSLCQCNECVPVEHAHERPRRARS